MPVTTQLHPLDPLSAEEMASAMAILRRERELSERTLVISIALVEPDKATLHAHAPEDAVARTAAIVLVDCVAETTCEATVSISDDRLLGFRVVEGRQAAIIGEEYEACEQLVKAHPDFAAALARRGITDQTLVCVDPIPAGTYVPPDLVGRRICRGLVWRRPSPGASPYGQPIEGIVALVDLNRREVIRIDDYGVVPVPSELGEYRTGRTGPEREGVRPIEVVQPEGASFSVEGNLISWQGWSFRAGWTMREGLVLHQLAYDDGDERRSILHRASVCEMAVPYGDPSPSRYIQCPFDIGENLIGSFANALELGCDCLGLIHYFDAVVCNGAGEPITLPNAICLHEEDAGLLWKHWDFRTGETEVRRSRRLVISFITTIGNYDYGFYWMLYLDGTIELEIKLTGIVATGAVHPGEQPAHGTLIAEGLYAMNHQHFFNARLDFDLDGERNAVYEVHTEASPAGPANPVGSAFEGVRTLLRSEAEAPQLIDPLSSRGWVVVNHERRNATGAPVGYRLVPGENCLPYVQEDSIFRKRAGFCFKHVWVTKFHADERYAAGEYPNLHPGGAGLPEFVADDEGIVDEDIVLWYSLGHNHLPRTEDWPIMPVWKMGFMLKPSGFFDRNPTLDVPPPRSSHSCCHGNGDGA